MANAKILVVDDEPDLREILVEELRDQGFEVSEASSGNEAWSLVQKTEFKVVISDIRMPHGDGIGLLKNIHGGSLAKPPIVFLLSGFSDLSEQDAKKLGARQVFSKPFELDMISQALKEASN